ncbi:THUMP-like domain-containing protein [Altibacter lentus]|uniref:THUMP-like domain-containing protein n=1 Tax=Altibacter lentus TaxID=1223410 RepID=UPI000554CD3F|nr:hypothetical protein [Altibacter lentus]
MNHNLLHTEVQTFIRSYDGPLEQLAFSKSPFTKVTVQELLQQIESRRKTELKLPTWFSSEGIYYPPKLNIEQTSSEATAAYKASLVSGASLADTTGGFGVDSYYFSKRFETVNHFEIDTELSMIAAHNFEVLESRNVRCFAQNGIEAVLHSSYDVIYADPSRRHDVKGKVFFLSDCEPNIPEHLEALMDVCNVLLIKTSPMLDLSVGMEALKYVSEIHIIALNNDVKELLWVLKKRSLASNPRIYTVNVTKESPQQFDFSWGTKASEVFDTPQRFLYEPNAALMKSGAFGLLSEVFRVKKLHANTHLYTSESLREFPGRRFAIDACVPYNKNAMKDALTVTKANIATRNFPESVAVIRKKWKLKDGGEHYLFFTTTLNDKKVLLICSKI